MSRSRIYFTSLVLPLVICAVLNSLSFKGREGELINVFNFVFENNDFERLYCFSFPVQWKWYYDCLLKRRLGDLSCHPRDKYGMQHINLESSNKLPLQEGSDLLSHMLKNQKWPEPTLELKKKGPFRKVSWWMEHGEWGCWLPWNFVGCQ